MERICPICNGTEFEPGFLGRMAANGLPPQCSGCKSAERHRALRLLYNSLGDLLSQWKVLQFAPDSTIPPGACLEYDYSIYGGHNSLDLQDIALEDNSYDLILSNHVFEHVEHDTKSLSECLRVVGPNGLVHVNAPSPGYRFRTLDWGFADPDKNEHYRDYGVDLGVRLAKGVSPIIGVAASPLDPVTSTPDTTFFFSKSNETMKSIVDRLNRAIIPCIMFSDEKI